MRTSKIKKSKRQSEDQTFALHDGNNENEANVLATLSLSLGKVKWSTFKKPVKRKSEKRNHVRE